MYDRKLERAIAERNRRRTQEIGQRYPDRRSRERDQQEYRRDQEYRDQI